MQNILDALKQLFKAIFMNNQTAPVIEDNHEENDIPAPIVAPVPAVAPQNAPKPVFVAPPLSKLDLWCEAAKIMENARPILNNPGNIKYIGQADAKNNGGFCQFPSYAIGMQHLRTMFINAATGKSEIYHPTDNLIVFYQKYAPSSDGNNPHNYALFVANHIGVPVNTEIMDLVK